MTTIDQVVLRRVKRRDRVARWIITLGGVVIIASVIAILFVIVSVTLPLLYSPQSELRKQLALPAGLAQPLALGVELVERNEEAGGDLLSAYALTADGRVTFFNFSATASAGAAEPAGALESHGAIASLAAKPPGAEDSRIVAVQRYHDRYSLLWSDGGVSLVQIGFRPHHAADGIRTEEPLLVEKAALAPATQATALQAAVRAEGEAFTCVRWLEGNRLLVTRQTPEMDLFGEKTGVSTSETLIEEGVPGPIAAIAVDDKAETIYVGTRDGHLARWLIGDPNKVVHESLAAFPDRRAVTRLAVLHGNNTLIVGDDKGEVSLWCEIRGKEGGKLRCLRQLASFDDAVTDIVPSGRDKSVLSLSAGGDARLDFATSGRNLLKLQARRGLKQIGYAEGGKAAIALDGDDRLLVWKLICPHPDVAWNVLFGKLQYEGYDEPVYKWQSSGDEPKMSLVPLVFGSVKSTLYAMLFATPLAIFGAIYVSHFTTPLFKRTIKPIVEIMAAVPSVVIGFLILLWLAPQMGRWLVAVFVSFVTIPMVFLAFMAIWQWVRRFDVMKPVENGYEFLVMVPVMCIGATLAWLLMGPVESALFGGSFRDWLFQALKQPYEQLNSIVVAFGLGFAVIPIIFSISEDSLSSIPHSLTAASLALGASRWQTVWRVVLPSASPGIFAAVMVGFGRALGETMIVFMAAGNTPLLDWSPFNGFRTLSANIATEMPEAARGATLYRVLFLCAVILFMLAFVLNTSAELVRQYLRKRYGKY